MRLFARKRIPTQGQVRILHLTNARRSVTTMRPVRNIPWLILSLPVRVFSSFWEWLMESKPTGHHRIGKSGRRD